MSKLKKPRQQCLHYRPDTAKIGVMAGTRAQGRAEQRGGEVSMSTYPPNPSPPHRAVGYCRYFGRPESPTKRST